MFSKVKILLKTNGFVAVETTDYIHTYIIGHYNPSVKTEQQETNGNYGRANNEKYSGHTNERRRNTLNTEFLPCPAEGLKFGPMASRLR